MKRWIIAATCLALLIAMVVIYCLPPPPSTPAVAMPTPNGYTELADAGQMVGPPPDDIDQAEPSELMEFLDANRSALAGVRKALRYDSRVPIEYSAEFLVQASNGLNGIRQAARLLMAESRLAEQQGRMADAAKANLELIVLSQKASNGGLLVHFQVGSAYERWAWTSLLRIAPTLTSEERSQFLSDFESISYQRRPMEVYDERELRLAIASHGRLITFIARRQANQVYERCVEIDNQRQTLMKEVLAKMAEP